METTVLKLSESSKWINRSNRAYAGERTDCIRKKGTIQAFEFTHELAWKVMKNFLEYKGVSNLFGSKDVTGEAFTLGLIENGEIWMRMIQSRNISSHTYDESIANEIIVQIKEYYFSKFVDFKIKTFADVDVNADESVREGESGDGGRMKYGLQEEVVDTIQSVFSKYPQISKVILYGSRAMGTERPGSDIDLTLIGEAITLTEITEMLVLLDELPLPYTFDLSYYPAIENNQLRNHIENFGVIFYEKTA